MAVTLCNEAVPPASVVKLAKACVPPTTPLKVVAPLLFAVRPCAPAVLASTGPPNVIPPLPVLNELLPASTVTWSTVNGLLLVV